MILVEILSIKKRGFINQIDDLGGIKIPDKLLDEFELKFGSEVEIIIDEDTIILRKKEDVVQNIKE